jgi:hypothetical protein
MEPQRPNSLEKQLTPSETRAIMKATRSGMLLQTPRTDIPLGLSPGCSIREELHKSQPKGVIDCAVGAVARRLFGFL